MRLFGWLASMRPKRRASSAFFTKCILDAEALEPLAESLAERYAHATPFKHVVIDEFLPHSVAIQLLRDFPQANSGIWIEQHPARQPGKLGITHASRLKGVEPSVIHALCQFNSFPFLRFLSKLTGISKLLPDPYLHGGGPQQIVDGGKLDVHTDFTHLAALNLYRRVNVLYYLNPNWRSTYGGSLELWSDSQSSPDPVRSIEPSFNRLVVFNTTSKTFHGHPKPLSVPTGVTRKSLAFYYYTARPEEAEEYTARTSWLQRTTSDP